MRKLILLLAALVLAGGFWLVSSRTTNSVGRTLIEANKNKILLLNVGSEPRTLDPNISQGVTEHHIIISLLEGLVIDDPNDQAKELPGVAERWEHNEDYSLWAFYFRPDAKWTNGDPVRAQDFVFSYRRALTPSLAAPYADGLFLIKGAEEFNKGKIKDFNEVGVTALDDRTLRIQLVGPTPYFLSAARHTIWLPIPEKVVLANGKFDDRDSRWILPENFVGNGAFKLKTWRKNDVIETVKSDTYWDRETVKLNGINFYALENPNTEDRAFQAGQLHHTNEVTLDKVPFYRRERPEEIRIDPWFGVYFMRINVQREALKDRRVRMALNLAVDRESLVKNVTRRGEKPATGFTPPGIGGYAAFDYMKYDPERARQLLAEAGYPDGRGFPHFDILINTNETHRTIAEAIQQMWRSELKIDVGIVNQEWKVYLDSQNNINYDLSRSGWIGDFIDPVTFLTIWTTGNGNNNTHWSNARYDELIAGAARMGDVAQRMAMLREAEQIFLEDPPVVLIYWYTRAYLLQPSVVNWNPLVLDNHPYKFVDLKPIE
jgi:oligopeptide transport system substrate-binding protein